MGRRGKTTLADYSERLTKEWHPKNKLTPFDVSFGSGKKIWWKCSAGHEWEATVGSRTGKRTNNCPYCGGKRVCQDNCLSTLNSELAKEWHPTKNKLTPSDVTLYSNKKVWWRCSKGHEWEAYVGTRSFQKTGCPYCCKFGLRACQDNCLATLNPELAKEWHPTKNKLSPSDVTSQSGRKFWWECSKGHEWKATVASRAAGSNCPYCSGRKAHQANCLATLNPELTKEWHPTKNGKLAPQDVLPYSGRKIWWECPKGHEWEAPVFNRSRNPNCPYCNCLAVLNPELAKEWHPTKNKLTPFDVTLGSEKTIWWKCSEEGHEWEASTANRSAGCNTIREPTGCPHGSQSKNERNCKIIFEKIFNKPFPTNRKIFGNRMELDGYCEELKLAFEYNGIQHYKRIPYWHRNGETLKKQQKRDKLKRELCKKKGICLIVIPYTENHRLEAFIREKSVTKENNLKHKTQRCPV